MSILLSTTMLMTVLLSVSCGDKTPEPEKTKVEHVYKAKTIDIGDNISPNTLMIAGEDALVYGYEIIDRENYTTQNILLKIDTETGDFTKTVMPDDDDSSGYVQEIAADRDGNIYFLKCEYDYDADTESYSIDRLVDNAAETLCDDISVLFEANEDSEFGYSYFYIQYFAIDAEGNFYIATDDSMIVCDSSCSKLFQIDIDGYIRGIGVTSEGKAYLSYYEYNGNSGSCIAYIDLEKKSVGENLPLPDTGNLSNADFYVGEGYDIYYKDESSLYGFNSADGEPVELLNFINSDVNPNTVSSMIVIDADTVLVYSRDYWSDTTTKELLLMNRVPEDEIQEKYVIRLGYYPNGEGTIESQTVNFNRASDEYRVELIDYSKYATDDDYSGESRLEKEILAGTAPDIIALDYFDNADNWIEQGVFTDLNKLIDEDESFDRSEYFESVLNAYTDSDGKMYRFVTNFYINTILANKSIVGYDGWDAETFISFVSSLPEDVYLDSYMSRDRFISMALSCSMDSFIDYDKATCSFDSESFKTLLELAKNMSEEYTSYYATLSEDEKEEYSNDRMKPYRDGTIILDANDGYINSIDEYASATVQYGKGIDVNFIGFPTNKGNGAIIFSNSSYAINEKSLLKDGAWEFIKQIANGASRRSWWGFSINIENFEKAAEDEIGGWHYYYANGSMGFGDSDMTYEEAMAEVEEMLDRRGRDENGVLLQTTKEHLEELKELINGAQAIPNGQSKIFDMINEEAAYYYDGTKSLDETVKIIQDRISTYISENS